jgi:hypothetical protein
VERLNRKKLNEVNVREPFQLKMPKRFLDLENLEDKQDTYKARENTSENIKITAQKSLSMNESSINYGLVKNVQN